MYVSALYFAASNSDLQTRLGCPVSTLRTMKRIMQLKAGMIPSEKVKKMAALCSFFIPGRRKRGRA